MFATVDGCAVRLTIKTLGKVTEGCAAHAELRNLSSFLSI